MLYLSSTYPSSQISLNVAPSIYCTWLYFHIMVGYKCICVFCRLHQYWVYISCKLTFSHHPMLVSYNKCINVFDLPVLIELHFPILIKSYKSSSLESFPNFWKAVQVYIFELYLFSNSPSPFQIHGIWWLQEGRICVVTVVHLDGSYGGSH